MDSTARLAELISEDTGASYEAVLKKLDIDMGYANYDCKEWEDHVTKNLAFSFISGEMHPKLVEAALESIRAEDMQKAADGCYAVIYYGTWQGIWVDVFGRYDNALLASQIAQKIAAPIPDDSSLSCRLYGLEGRIL
ncbi:MAG: hypothetical protein GY861_07275 [bacterium]|nr:hypothetical protein [bacterium]